MCVQQKLIYTNSHFLSKNYYKSFRTSSACGKCCECKGIKKAEYSLRSFYQAKETFLKNGFVVFDTLTYGDSLPMISDHFPAAGRTCWNRSCFSRDHIKKFFKLLRIHLVREGYKVDGNLKYFLAGEYGLDDRFTHRPHYHVLFYVTFPIDPVYFSKCVSSAWIYGRTDGVKYKGIPYFKEQRLFYGNTPHSMAVSQYVAKYVNKDSIYTMKLVRNLNIIFNIVMPKNWREFQYLRNEFVRVYRQCSMFHVESKGFGEYCFKENPVEKIVENGFLSMPISDTDAILRVPITNYFKRKLFYEQFWFNGSRFWRVNELGRKYLPQLMDKQIEKFCLKIDAFLKSFDDNDFKNFCFQGRSVRDFAEYVFFKKDRIKCDFPETVPLQIFCLSISSEAFNLKQQFLNDDLFYGYLHSVDRLRFGRRFVSKSFLLTSSFLRDPNWQFDHCMFSNHGVGVDYNDIKDPYSFWLQYCYHDVGFDMMYDSYLEYVRDIGRIKQSEYDRKMVDNYYMAKQGIKVKNIM